MLFPAGVHTRLGIGGTTQAHSLTKWSISHESGTLEGGGHSCFQTRGSVCHCSETVVEHACDGTEFQGPLCRFHRIALRRRRSPPSDSEWIPQVCLGDSGTRMCDTVILLVDCFRSARNQITVFPLLTQCCSFTFCCHKKVVSQRLLNVSSVAGLGSGRSQQRTCLDVP